MRFPQPDMTQQPNGGSQKWLQRGVNQFPDALNDLIRPKLGGANSITWQSPLAGAPPAGDEYAEYRDACFLEKVGLERLSPELPGFWPNRGPQWDALAQFDSRGVLLVEAKAHIGELCSTRCGAKGPSLAQIEDALNETAEFLRATPRAPWTERFYQLANRIAHLYFLRNHGINAKLVLINFVGDSEVDGPKSKDEWQAAYQIVWQVLGVPTRNTLSSNIIELFPDVRSAPWSSL